MSDPGPEHWATQDRRLRVLSAIRDIIEHDPDRYTGMTTQGAGHATVYTFGQTVRDDPLLNPLLDEARAEGIAVDVVPVARSLRTLTRIHDEIIRTFQQRRLASRGVDGGRSMIDAASATVQVAVAAAVVGLVREEFASHGDAVVVTAFDTADLMTRLPRHHGSRDGWPAPSLPVDDAVGSAADDVAAHYRAEGFRVEALLQAYGTGLDADLRPDRIRLLVDEGLVLDATQG